MASNEHVDLRKIENFVRSKGYPEDIPNVKWKKANFRISKSLRALKSLMNISHTKGKEGWYLTIIENFQYDNTTLFYRNPILIYEIWIANKVTRVNALT